MTHASSGPPLATLLVVLASFCLSFPHDVEAGGKGKGGRQGHIIIQNEIKDRNQVPIYMPIPIPIPMPVGPMGGGGNKFHQHHHQQQHSNDGEGEVKKIYLLQPMAKIAPPMQHTKPEGYVGPPVQTHIHVTPSGHHNHHQTGKRPYQETEGSRDTGDSGHTQEHTSRYGSKSSHYHSDLKILPIVVIPPIAPMPPIQVPSQSGHHHQAPRMTLTPQFNNFVVSGSESSGSSGKKYPGHQGKSHVTLLQDHKSFSDYGLGARSSSDHRDYRVRPRLANQDYLSSRSRSRQFDDYGDAEDADYGAQSWNGWRGNSQLRNRWAAADQRRRRWPQSAGNRLARDSIRDLVDQQQLSSSSIQFDDDPLDDYGDSSSAGSARASGCCSQGRRQSSPRLVGSSSDMNYPLSLEMANGSDRRGLSGSSQVDNVDLGNRHADLNGAVHYDRDYPDTPLSSRQQAVRLGSGANRQLHLDPNELLDDDEWRMDSVKSVAHSSVASQGSASLVASASRRNSTSSPSPHNFTSSSAQTNLS